MTGSMPSAGRVVAGLFIDCLSAFEDSDESDSRVMNRLAADLASIDGAIGVREDDGALHVDVSSLLGGALVPMEWLLTHLAQASGKDVDVLLFGLREVISEY